MNVKDDRKVIIFDPTNRAPYYLYYFCQSLTEEGIRITTVAPRRLGYPNIPKQDQSMPSIPKNFLGKGLVYCKMWWKLIRVVGRNDIVHIQWLPAIYYFPIEFVIIMLLRLRGLKVMLTQHNMAPHGKREKGYVYMVNYVLYRTVDQIFVHANRSKEHIKQRYGIPDERISCIPHGPMFYERSGSPSWNDMGSRKYLCGMIGNIVRYKNVEDAVRALYCVHKRYPQANMIIAGRWDREYLEEIKELVEEFEMRERVNIVDKFLDDEEIISLHKETMMTVFPYKKISQSGAVMTALGLGCPVVVYDVGGLGENVVDGKNGRIVSAGDVAGLCAAICDVIRNWEKYVVGVKRTAGSEMWQTAARECIRYYRMGR